MHRRIRLYQTSAAIGLALFAAQSVAAQQSTASGNLPRSYQQLSSYLKPDGDLPAYLEALRSQFADLDADQDGKISQRDADLHDAIARSRLRAQTANSLMRYDIDGDGIVTTAEIRIAITYDQRASAARSTSRGGSTIEARARQLQAQIQQLTEKDTNGDGKITYVEAAKLDEAMLDRRFSGQESDAGRVKNALTLDGAKNGQLEQAAWLAAGEALFRKIDVSKDGKLGQQELVDFWQNPSAPDAVAQQKAIDDILARARQIESKPQRTAQPGIEAGCAMPAPSQKSRVLMLGAYETPGLSSTTLGSDDAVIHAGKVVIEPGTQPLYIVMSSYSSSIWQFSGAVQRIERVVVSSSETARNDGRSVGIPLVGVTGVPKAKVSFFAKAGCLSDFYEIPSASSVRAANKVREMLGRDPDGVFGKYSVMTFNLPSGRIEEIKGRYDGKLVIEGAPPGTLKIEGDASHYVFQAGPSRARDELLRFSPAGVISIDPKTVVGSMPAKHYGVLPQQAGLVQLLASGALKQNASGEYVVQKQMAFPAGLGGAHAVEFVVPKGVPMPTGDPGHSCVVAADRALKQGAICR